ncbi:CRE-DHS-27 protein [Aphelenchoides avenae]|nr:CRE-DHS-27 protein [Aphelenchus avenae]
MASDGHEAEKRILNAALERKDSTIRTHMGDTAEWNLERIGVGHGFLSTVFKRTLNRRTFPRRSVNELVLKLPGTTALDDNDAYVELLHNRECMFYECIGPMEGVPVPRLIASKEIDRTTGEKGYVIMEHVANCRSFTFEESLNAGQIRQLVHIGAAIHANALLNKDRWQGREWLKPVNSARFDTDKRAAEAQKRCVRRACKGALLRPLIALRHMLEDSDFHAYLLNERHKEIGFDSILCHGDLHVDNFLLKVGPDGKLLDEVGAVIDWQLVNEANAEVRRNTEKWITKEYLAHLGGLLQREGIDVPSIFTEERLIVPEARTMYDGLQLHEAYRAALVYHAFRLSKFTVFRTGSTAARKNFAMRTKAALEDAVRIIDEDMPLWHTSRLARSKVFILIAKIANRVF